ncbi:MAG TPA: histidine kinase [Candidatus Dormibacteraeota bacterium]
MTLDRVDHWGRAAMLAWNLLLLAAVVQLLLARSQIFPGAEFAGTTCLLGVAAVWTWYWLRCPMPVAGTLLAGVAITVMILAIALPAPPASVTSLLVYASVVLVAGLSWRWGLVAVVAITLLASLTELAKGSLGVALTLAANEFLVGMLALGGRALILAYQELLRARDEIARLAVAEERLRFARDLHDLLGHSLAVVVLKSEVVARQLPEGEQRAEAREVAQVARRALDQVREAVAGYRAPNLAGELADARSALRAAGIQVALENKPGPLTPAIEGLLGWAVREGATNVIKHASAARCRIRLVREGDEAVLEIVNDGAAAGQSPRGNGLRGMEERAGIVGGAVSTKLEGGEFRLRLRVPVGARLEAVEALRS